jgi:arylsulfatase A-like enzyme
LHAPKKFFDQFPLNEVQMPKILVNDLADCAKPLWNPNQTWNNAGFSKYKFLTQHHQPDLWKRWVQAYLANVAFVDEQVGKVLQAIKESKYAKNTIIVLTSDHGYHLGEKDYLFKCSLWEESSRIPMAIKMPKMPSAGLRISHPVSLIDLYPTLVDLCNLPENPNEHTNGMKLDGFSLKPFLENMGTESWPGPDFALISVAADDELEVNQEGDPAKQFYALRTEQFRYILCPNGAEELYDHETDPYEWHNLAKEEKYAETKAALKAQLLAMISNS